MKQRAHILVVDDQADNLLILEDALSDLYDVHPAVNGREALRYLNGGGRADLILLDVMMPEIDGYEVCRRLKSSESTRTIPVLFLTGLDRPEDEERGLELGAEDFIHKPGPSHSKVITDEFPAFSYGYRHPRRPACA